MQTHFNGRTFFPPNKLPATDGQEALTIVQVLTVDAEGKKIEIVQVLGAPDSLVPNNYTFNCEIRAKKEKSGSSFWFRACEPAGK